MKKSTFQLAFSLLHESSPEGGSLDVVAPDEKTFEYWTDGINALLGEELDFQASWDSRYRSSVVISSFRVSLR